MGTLVDRYPGEEIAEAVVGAVAAGYRLIDCAAVYGNEHLIGPKIAEAMDKYNVKREELFIISKLWNDMHGDGDVLISVARL